MVTMDRTRKDSLRTHTCVTALDTRSRCIQSGAANARCNLGQTRATPQCTPATRMELFHTDTDYSYFRGVPVGPDRPCWGSARAYALSYSAVKLFSKYSNL